jgi:hypothetical protein
LMVAAVLMLFEIRSARTGCVLRYSLHTFMAFSLPAGSERRAQASQDWGVPRTGT